jgi:ABC-type branched-subunit amino acid transport system substrate-binding protein
LLTHTTRAVKAKRVCAVVPRTTGGRSIKKVFTQRAGPQGLRLVHIAQYSTGATDFQETLAQCRQTNAQVVRLVAHWDLTGGSIQALVGSKLEQVQVQVQMHAIQTLPFINNQRPASRRLANWLIKDMDLKSVDEVPRPVGSAQAYDMAHLLALAQNRAGNTSDDSIRISLENLPAYEGAVKRYAPAFTAKRHDALNAQQVRFVKISRAGVLTPLTY